MKFSIRKFLAVFAALFASCCGSTSAGEKTVLEPLDERFPSNWDGLTDAMAAGLAIEEVSP